MGNNCFNTVFLREASVTSSGVLGVFIVGKELFRCRQAAMMEAFKSGCMWIPLIVFLVFICVFTSCVTGDGMFKPEIIC